MITFVDNSVKVDSTKLETSQYTYQQDTGKLTINLPSIDVWVKKTVTFEVRKK